MTKDKFYERLVRNLIDDDPTDIVITRHIETPTKYGNTAVETKGIPVRGRFYRGTGLRSSGSNPLYQEGGVYHRDLIILKGLFVESADVQVGDTFSINKEQYNIMYVNHYKGFAKVVFLEYA